LLVCGTVGAAARARASDERLGFSIPDDVAVAIVDAGIQAVVLETGEACRALGVVDAVDRLLAAVFLHAGGAGVVAGFGGTHRAAAGAAAGSAFSATGATGAAGGR